MIRTAYAQYYGKFGLTPEAVGIGAARILSDLLIGPVLIGAIFGFVYVLSYLGQLRFRSGPPAQWPVERRPFLLRVAAAALSLGMVASSVDLGVKALHIPLLQVSARHVTRIASNGSTDSGITALKGDPCLLVIGEADGRTYIYQTRERVIHSISTNTVNYTVDAVSAALDPSCAPPQ